MDVRRSSVFDSLEPRGKTLVPSYPLGQISKSSLDTVRVSQGFHEGKYDYLSTLHPDLEFQ